MTPYKILIITLRVVLGGLLIVGGTSKFSEEDAPQTTQQSIQAETKKQPSEQHTESHKIETGKGNHAKIMAYIDGLKGTGYFWGFLGIAELLCGLLLISQFYSLLGAVMAIPIMLNIFLMHVFLEYDEMSEVIINSLFLLANILIIGYDYQKLKPIFLPKNWI